jgi:hypothetical protein
MRVNSAPRFPNGERKSRLYEVFLSYRDFDCTASEYLEQIAFTHKEEDAGNHICAWYQDGGVCFVHGLQFRNPRMRVIITESGFRVEEKPMNPTKVFVCYAREDIAHARRLASDLRAVGVEVWFDKDTLRPGERWETAIRRAIKASDFFVAVLSTHSLKKRGFVQTELRTALDILLQVPEEEIYLIPARIEPCEPSHPALTQLNYLDLFPDWEAGINRLVAVVKRA